MSLNDTVKTLAKTLKTAGEPKTQPYDTEAVVRRVEDGVAWVHIPGGVDETPVRLTMAAKEGDTVQVRVSNGRAFLQGNATAPPTDDSTAKAAKAAANNAFTAADSARRSAESALDSASTAASAAAQAIEDAEDAEKAAQEAQDSLKSVVKGATTVEKAVSVMQTALESVAEYDATTATATYSGDGTQTAYTLDRGAVNVVSVTIDDTETTDYTAEVVDGQTVVTFATAPADGAEIVVTHETLREWFWHDAAGAHVLGDESGYRNDISSTGMSIVEVETEDSVAEFGANGVRIGKEGESRIKIDSSQFVFFDDASVVILQIRKGRVQTEQVNYTDPFWTKIKPATGIPVGVTHAFGELVLGEATPLVFSINEEGGSKTTFTFVSEGTQTQGAWEATLANNVIVATTAARPITYNLSYSCTQKYNAPLYVIGEGTANGSFSAVIGRGNTVNATAALATGYKTNATGDYSHTEGKGTVAGGEGSHAEGTLSVANGDGAHAEGYGWQLGEYLRPAPAASGRGSHAEGYGNVLASGEGSHAEGVGGVTLRAGGRGAHAEGNNTYADGDASHAEGIETYAIGDASHAQNIDTRANEDGQTAIGKYNDNKETTALEIGNGDEQNRSNALEVYWDGNVCCAIDTTAAAGTTDGDLYAAIEALGWESEVID